MEVFGSTYGIFMTIIIGIAGSFLATFLGRSMGWYAGNQTAGIIGSVLGAIILLIVYGMATRKRKP